MTLDEDLTAGASAKSAGTISVVQVQWLKGVVITLHVPYSILPPTKVLQRKQWKPNVSMSFLFIINYLKFINRQNLFLYL